MFLSTSALAMPPVNWPIPLLLIVAIAAMPKLIYFLVVVGCDLLGGRLSR